MKKRLALSLLLSAALPPLRAHAQAPAWPAITQQNRPWTRWWWEGSAVNPQDLSHLLTQYQQAGLGGVEITAIYGVKGAESQFIDFLSPKWMDMLTHTLTDGKRLGLGVDVAQASGWPFGGPWVTPTDACKYVAYQTYTLKGGEQLSEKISFTQKPIASAIGHKVDIKQLADPIATNKNMQALALEQVRYEKPLPLQALMAYPEKGAAVDLTSKVDASGKLNWTAPAGNWTLYAIFQGWHGKQVERAGPGGEGDVIDHFSKIATTHYLQRFDQAFKGRDVKSIRAFFNDSYEVDDAQGESNWTPLMFSEFQKRRGYDLRQHLPGLFAKASTDENARVLTDYRETISELLLENYTEAWATWAHGYGVKIAGQYLGFVRRHRHSGNGRRKPHPHQVCFVGSARHGQAADFGRNRDLGKRPLSFDAQRREEGDGPHAARRREPRFLPRYGLFAAGGSLARLAVLCRRGVQSAEPLLAGLWAIEPLRSALPIILTSRPTQQRRIAVPAAV
jgi:hypothetical protein